MVIKSESGERSYNMTISVFIAPIDAQQISVPPPQLPPAPRLTVLDEQLIAAVGEHEGPVPVWPLLNWLTAEQAPASRAECRRITLELWGRLRRLLRMRILFRAGRKSVATTRPAPRPRRAPRRWLQPSRPWRNTMATVSVGERSIADSTLARQDAAIGSKIVEQPQHELLKNGLPRCPAVPAASGNKSATPEEIKAAARALAGLRYHKKRWTGWLHGCHCRRGQPLVLESGEVAELAWCSRRRVLLQIRRDMEFRDYLRWAARREHQVRLCKRAEAVALGRMKRGCKERPSTAKAQACRLNGARGGRPRKRDAHPAAQSRPA
jgi:hypothetical protein